MDDYLIRAELARKATHYEINGYKTAKVVLLKDVLEAPAADVQPIVRCRDCEFGEDASYGDGTKCVVCWNDYVSPSSRIRTPDWFCAEAVPKEPDIDDE